jgi:hypothetical protein
MSTIETTATTAKPIEGAPLVSVVIPYLGLRRRS